MEKLGFVLDVEDGWPPVAVEHVWCEPIGSIYELRNAPFFLHGLAYGDRFTVRRNDDDGYISEFSVVQSSGHSLVWVLDQGTLTIDRFKPDLFALNCSIEGFARFRLHAIDIPPSADAAMIEALLDRLEAFGLAVAFPVWRHESPAPA